MKTLREMKEDTREMRTALNARLIEATNARTRLEDEVTNAWEQVARLEDLYKANNEDEEIGQDLDLAYDLYEEAYTRQDFLDEVLEDLENGLEALESLSEILARL